MKFSITPSRFRTTIQAVFTLFCLYAGYRFTAFLAWTLGQTEIFAPKPGAVEGFLPISALLGLRQLLETGLWDKVHPAGLTIFLAVLLMAWLFRKGFCGYICPVGFISNLIERAGRAIGLGMIPHRYVDRPLTAVKYILLGGFCFSILSMDTRSVGAFITGPYNMVADARMLQFFTNPSALSLLILGGLAGASLIVRNVWCRYLCPYGALLGLVAWIGPIRIRRNTTTCIDCGKCSAQCPAGITVQNKKTVGSPECIGCAECIGACPVEDCLSFSLAGKKRIPWLSIAIGSVLTLLVLWGWAKATGHWDSQIPQFVLKRIYLMFFGGA